jgi:hypothetical protein
MGRKISKILGGIAGSTGGIFGENEHGPLQTKVLTHVPVLYREHSGSRDHVGRRNSKHCAEDI